MLQLRDRFGFRLEASELCIAGMRTGEDHLQGHETIELDVPCLVDDTHAAAAEHAEYLVVFHARTRRTCFLLGRCTAANRLKCLTAAACRRRRGDRVERSIAATAWRSVACAAAFENFGSWLYGRRWAGNRGSGRRQYRAIQSDIGAYLCRRRRC